jgi:hypothetical protein
VGLTMLGWSGRFIEFGRLRDIPDVVKAGELEKLGMRVVGMEWDAMILSSDDLIDTGGWLRPKLMAGFPVVMVDKNETGWKVIGKKEKEDH